MQLVLLSKRERSDFDSACLRCKVYVRTYSHYFYGCAYFRPDIIPLGESRIEGTRVRDGLITLRVGPTLYCGP